MRGLGPNGHRRGSVVILLPLLVMLTSCSSSKPAHSASTPPASVTRSAESTGTTQAPASQAAAGPKDATYLIEGRWVTLTNGLAETEAAPGSASKITTKYFGNEASGDFNGDGLDDVGFLLTQSGGGSGTFFYAAVALQTKSGYVGTNGVLLGDRIAPQTTQARNGELVVNYADRKPGEAMTTPPSVGVTRVFRIQDGKLVERP